MDADRTLPARASEAPPLVIEIDHREAVCPAGVTVLRAAEMNGVFIPSLCSHKDLSPFGGCRLCMVEIAGMRGYPLACSTIVQPGMQVQTDTVALREMRREILELILSEHPASCIVCGEKDACRGSQQTIRKSGVATGCRSCPNDGVCELQALAERLGVTEIHYPVYYRGYEPEHDDPFFDRDYNVCILCGRCVRMCQEVRGASVLAFTFRGPATRIGPAFGRDHVEAGCEFCGACVSVCPTGALADKVSKWDGKPDDAVVSTCPFCALGCRLVVQRRGGRLSSAAADLDHEINDGQLCVRGRFCLPEMTHHHERRRKPALARGPYFRDVSWPEAVEEVAQRLGAVDPRDVLLVVSPDLSNEGLWAARTFARAVLPGSGLDSTARDALPGGVPLWRELLGLPVSIRAIGEADAIVAVGLDARFDFSIAGVEIRRALRRGATLVTIDARDSNLARSARLALRPRVGAEGDVLGALADRLTGGRARLAAAASRAGVDAAVLDGAFTALARAGRLAVVVGPTAFATDPGTSVAEALSRLAARAGTTFLPLYHGANTRGALELGVLDGAGPLSLADVLAGRARPKVLWLVGEAPCLERPDADYVIAQDLYAPPFAVDAFLPAASFAEADGTLTNVEGRVQAIEKIEDLPDGAITGFARPDWFIFGALAERLGSRDLAFAGADDVRAAIARDVPGFPGEPDRRPRRVPVVERTAPGAPYPARRAANGDGWRLVVEPGAFRHRGVDMSFPVEGLHELGLEDGLRLNPDDCDALGLAAGDDLVLEVDGTTLHGPVRPDPDCPAGAIYVQRPFAFGGLAHRAALAPAFRLPFHPVPVTPRPGARREG